MKRTITKSQLRNIIAESIKMVLNENSGYFYIDRMDFSISDGTVDGNMGYSFGGDESSTHSFNPQELKNSMDTFIDEFNSESEDYVYDFRNEDGFAIFVLTNEDTQEAVYAVACCTQNEARTYGLEQKLGFKIDRYIG